MTPNTSLVLHGSSASRTSPFPDGLTILAPDSTGTLGAAGAASATPSYTGSQRRITITRNGRLLAVIGKHGDGPWVTWMDPPGRTGASHVTRGDDLTGKLWKASLQATPTGSLPASVTLANDSTGAECAYVVWGSVSTSDTIANLWFRRLTELDSPLGPIVGPLVSLDTPLNVALVDIVAEGMSPSQRLFVSYVRKTAATPTYETTVACITNLDTDSPTLSGRFTVVTGDTSTIKSVSLISGRTSTAIVARTPGGIFKLWVRQSTDAVGTWTAGTAAPAITGISSSNDVYPSGVQASSDEWLVALEYSTTNNSLRFYRWSANGGTVTNDIDLVGTGGSTGYKQPCLADNGQAAIVVMRRMTDDTVVARRWTKELGWQTSDSVLISSEQQATWTFPNVERSCRDGKLRALTGSVVIGDQSSRAILLQRSTI